MKKQMDLFSRNFDRTHYDNATKILGALKGSGFKGNLPRVSTWELYDKSFTWPKIRQYETVQEGMENLEHYEDNLNTNITNSRLLEKFITQAKSVQSQFNTKYHNGEFKDPATNLPEEE
jgi:hypothetical protein